MVTVVSYDDRLPQTFFVQRITPGRTQVLQSREKLTIKRLAMHKSDTFILDTSLHNMLADYSCESLPCVAAISSWEPLAHFVHLASPPAHWRDSWTHCNLAHMATTIRAALLTMWATVITRTQLNTDTN